MVESPPVGKMLERMTGVLILHVLMERKPDVLQRLKHFVSRINTSLLYLHISVHVCIYISLPIFPHQQENGEETKTCLPGILQIHN